MISASGSLTALPGECGEFVLGLRWLIEKLRMSTPWKELEFQSIQMPCTT